MDVDAHKIAEMLEPILSLILAKIERLETIAVKLEEARNDPATPSWQAGEIASQIRHEKATGTISPEFRDRIRQQTLPDVSDYLY